ncbi:FAD-dependent oxidoreductase [Syntrophomonas wolfei]|jgi:electron transfer flavoprotein-quinone oxidoreductase|uniref:FAD-dependent oxidoreductase n=1 Tax=Syntrophomonas wolfei TaxID=863 RepID=UPI0023EFD674|nr:FAD-dependent oxidoreductase [Syntrophomonas wolfei]
MGNNASVDFDAIIIGGGLSGLSAAYTLACAGKDVLLLERGDYCGSKNVTGGRIYLNPIRDYFPDLWENAPFERYIAFEELCVTTAERAITVKYSGQELDQKPYQSYSLLRGKFDKWFAKQAEKKGAAIVNKSRVDDLLFDNGKVVGVKTGGEELRANVIIASDGVLSFAAERAGLRRPFQQHYYAVGMKEVIELNREIIESRFNLEGDQGTARLFMGDATGGKFGGGFLYTNKDSISLGLVVGINALTEGTSVSTPVLLERFKQNPPLRCLIKDGKTVEYSAHLIPEGGLNMMGRLYGDGILVAGDAAGFSMNIGVTVRGMEYAMATGYWAAKAVMRALEDEDYSANKLSIYEKMLNESFVMKDFNNFKHALNALDNSNLFTIYPELAGRIMRDLYEIPAGQKEKLFTTLKKHISLKTLFGAIKDFKRMMKI